jgi:hypothetical protein
LTLTVLFTETPLDGVYTPDRARKKYRELVQLMEELTLCQVVTGLDVYSNMVIERISVNRQTGSGYLIEANIEMKEIEVATQEIVTVPADILKANTKKKGEGTTDTGQQGTEEATEEQADKGSILVQGVDDIRS